jgi:hypothetical protein
MICWKRSFSQLNITKNKRTFLRWPFCAFPVNAVRERSGKTIGLNGERNSLTWFDASAAKNMPVAKCDRL